MVNKNKFHHTLCITVFGCDDNGQIEFPSTPEEYIEKMEKNGVVFGNKDYSVKYINYTWVFDNGKEPVIKSYSSSLIDELIKYL